METLQNQEIFSLLDTESYSNLSQEILKSRIIYLYRGNQDELKKVYELNDKLDIQLNVINLKN